MESDEELGAAFQRLRKLVDVAPPLILELYDCYDRIGTLSRDDFTTAVGLLESYIFRRSVCDMQTRSLGQIFANLAYRIEVEQPLLSLKVALKRQTHARRFPDDSEFLAALQTRDVCDMRQCSFLLDRLENAGSNEKRDTSKLSIEHVMPQNKNLRSEWKKMLGEDWEEVQQTWLHRLGNVTLTGYNPKYSDRPFEEKKGMEDGFNDSQLRLNKFIREQTLWTDTKMKKRGQQLATKALTVWPKLEVDKKGRQGSGSQRSDRLSREIQHRKGRLRRNGPRSVRQA